MEDQGQGFGAAVIEFGCGDEFHDVFPFSISAPIAAFRLTDQQAGVDPGRVQI